MKIGFLYIRSPDDDDPIPELVFGCLKAYLDKYLDNSVDMFRLNPDNLHECDVVAMSTLSQDFGTAKIIAQDIKQKHPAASIIMGGQHVTWLHETLIPEMDFAVIGEGEQTFLELIRYFINGKKEEDLFKINGIVFWKDGVLVTNPRRELIENLDDLPHPFREDLYKANNRHIFTSRGCAFKCSFCSSAAFWKKIRFHSADYVVDEIESLRNIGTGNIPVMDDLFVANKRRFAEIIEKLKKKGLDKDYKMVIQVTAHYVTDELIEILKGFRVIDRVIFSSESGCDRILKSIGKGTTVAMNQAVTDKLYDAGISCGTSWIVGWPGETEAELRETCRWIKKNGRKKFPMQASFNILMPLPGTKVWNDAVRSGLIDIKTFDWNRLKIWAPQGNFPGWETWKNARKHYNTIYLNERFIPQEKLYTILEEEGFFN